MKKLIAKLEIRIDNGTKEKLQQLHKKDGVSNYIRQLIKEDMNKQKRKTTC